MNKVKIIGTGSYVPENIVTNDFLSSIVDTSDEWITTRTGIKQRNISSGENTSYLGAKAAIRALEHANVQPGDIDLIIVGTMSPDDYMPNTACKIQGIIGADRAVCFDINVACSGFIFALNTATQFIKTGMYKTAVVIGAEVLSKLVNWEDRSTCILFGDGAGAVVLKESSDDGICNSDLGCQGSKGEVLQCKGRKVINPFTEVSPNVEEYMTMSGQDVFKFAVSKVPESIEKVLNDANLNPEDVKYYVLHQANERIITAAAKRLGVSVDRFPINLNKYGNTSSASIPIVLDELYRDNKLNKGDKVILSGFGGGLSWGTTLMII